MKLVQIIGILIFLAFIVLLFLGVRKKDKKKILLSFILFLVAGVCVYIDDPTAFNNNEKPQKTPTTDIANNESTEKEVTKKENDDIKKHKYKTELDWADHKNYMFAVENETFDGDIVDQGKYVFSSNGVSDDKHVSIVWDIYISDKLYGNISQLSTNELVTSVGGKENYTASIELKKGQYVYIKYNNTALKPSGVLNIKIVE